MRFIKRHYVNIFTQQYLALCKYIYTVYKTTMQIYLHSGGAKGGGFSAERQQFLRATTS